MAAGRTICREEEKQYALGFGGLKTLSGIYTYVEFSENSTQFHRWQIQTNVIWKLPLGTGTLGPWKLKVSHLLKTLPIPWLGSKVLMVYTGLRKFYSKIILIIKSFEGI